MCRRTEVGATQTFSLLNTSWVGWVVDLDLFNNLLVMSQLGGRRYQISEIQVARAGFEFKTQALKHSTISAPRFEPATHGQEVSLKLLTIKLKITIETM